MEMSIYLFIFLLCCFLFDDVVSRRRYQGLSTNDHKIVGGYNVTIQEVPYQVYLLLQSGNDSYQCGGSIISAKYVLTAAHCLTGMDRIYVRAGSTLAMSGGTQYNTTSFRQHPFYNPMTFDYDVGLVRIPNGINLDGVNTRAIQLPRAGSSIPNGTNILVSGWGDTTENGQVSENLMAVQVQTITNRVCRRTYTTLTSRQVCAGAPGGGKDSCQGDSGGPAVSTDSNQQIGIVSFGTGCARPGYPGVYTRVSSVIRWIRMNTRI